MRTSFRHIFLVCLLLLSTLSGRVHAQNIGDYGAITSGAWTTVSIWRQWNGSAWATVPASFPAGATANVYILSGSQVTLPSPGPYTVGLLTVETGGKLFNNIPSATTPVYMSVWGTNIVCNGEIGNGTNYDALSFNIEGPSCTVSGTGTFTACRIRKNANTNVTTNFIVAMNISLRWSSSSATAIYNACVAGPSAFNVTINAGCTLNVVGSPTTPANFSIDGVDGLGAAEAYGTVTVNGTLIVTGILYASTNNTIAGNTASIIIGSGGVINANQINSPASGTGGLAFTVQNNARLVLTGPTGFAVTGGAATWGTTNNRYSFVSGSTVEYSYAGNQLVLHPNDFSTSTAPNHQYWHLVTSGSGNKTLRATVAAIPVAVRGNLNITGASVLDQATNNPNIDIGGNWTNYNQSGFNQSLNTTKTVRFYGNGTTIGPALTQTITCPGGEVFTNLQIAKTANGTVKMMSPVTVTNKLTLGQGNQSYWGVLDLNRNTLTLDNPAAAAIELIGTGSYNRYIICEDNVTTNGAKVRWNIGATSTPVPNIGLIITGQQSFWPWPYMIPFGVNGNSDTIPFGFYKPTTANMGYLTVATYGTPADNQPWPTGPGSAVTNLNALDPAYNTPDNRDWTVDRFWYIGADNPVSGCGVALLYDAGLFNPNPQGSEFALADNDPWNMLSQYWDAPNSTWALPQRGIGVGPISIPLVGTIPIPAAVIDTGFSIWNTHWTLTSVTSPLYGSTPLPIELLSFTAHAAGDAVRLDWITATEINNRYFTVERSSDGRNFTPIGTVEGSGNTSQQHAYGFTDRQPLSGVSYYRLRQTDFDGKNTLSEVRSVDRSKRIESGFVLSPNPTAGISLLSLAGELREKITVSVTDINGREVVRGGFEPAETGTFPIDLSSFSAGIYQVRLSGISVNSSFRLVKE
jgi:hypothetical protein